MSTGIKQYLSYVFITFLLAVESPSLLAAPTTALGYTPKYAPGFTHFDYVNPKAPKGGQLRLSAIGSFDRLNPFLLKGIVAEGVTGLVFETLMEQSSDEPYSLYGHLAEDIVLAEDKLSVIFRLNPRARFSDGKAVTAQDVKFSFDTLKSERAHPFYRLYWGDIKEAKVIDNRSIRFNFAKVNPELHLIVAQMPVFARAWIKERPFDSVALDIPIGSGPYRVVKFNIGKTITYERNPEYWAKDLNTRRGMFNFDRITFVYFQDGDVRLEGFKSGEFDFIAENNSKQWARDYLGPQFADASIKKEEIKHSNNAGMQGFVFNLRREMFKDKRVRQAITLAMDFEWSNKNLFYNQYKRCFSYFSNSELASSGIPQGEELALLEPFRDRLPKEVFTTAWLPPSTNPPSSIRDNLRKAKALLTEAGWQVKDGVLQNAKGMRLEFDVLLAQKGFERILAPFAGNLEKLGVKMNYRKADIALYQRRLDQFDFDVVVETFGQSQSPGNELINMWHSSSAKQEGSGNVIGLQDPVIDALIEKVVYAPDRQHLVTAARALDRVLLHGEYLVPNWFTPIHRIAYRANFAYPKTLPLYYQAEDWMIRTWWIQ